MSRFSRLILEKLLCIFSPQPPPFSIAPNLGLDGKSKELKNLSPFQGEREAEALFPSFLSNPNAKLPVYRGSRRTLFRNFFFNKNVGMFPPKRI